MKDIPKHILNWSWNINSVIYMFKGLYYPECMIVEEFVSLHLIRPNDIEKSRIVHLFLKTNL